MLSSEIFLSWQAPLEKVQSRSLPEFAREIGTTGGEEDERSETGE